MYLLKIPGEGTVKLQFDNLNLHTTDFLEVREGLTDQDSFIATVGGNYSGKPTFYFIAT